MYKILAYVISIVYVPKLIIKIIFDTLILKEKGNMKE